MKNKKKISALLAIVMGSVMALSTYAWTDVDEYLMSQNQDIETSSSVNVSMTVGTPKDLSGFIQYGVLDEEAADQWYLDEAVHWRSSNSDIVSVNEKGVATAHRVGTVKITAIAGDNHSRKHVQTIIIGVSSAQKITSQTSFQVGDGTWLNLRRLAEIHSGSADFTWSSSNTDVATVDSEGLVETHGIGRCTITAAYTDETGVVHSLKYPVRVTALLLSDRTQESTILLKPGDSVDVGVLFYPNYQSLPTALRQLSCTVSDSNIASSNTLVLKANKSGVTTATLDQNDGVNDCTLQRIRIVVQSK